MSARLAEAQWGAGRGYANVFYATIGTGIGTGIVLDGRIYHGRTGAAAEGGHISIDYRGDVCGCGKRGCIEVFAAGPAIARRARRKLAEKLHSRSVVLELANGDVEAVTSETIGQAYRPVIRWPPRYYWKRVHFWPTGWAISWIFWSPT